MTNEQTISNLKKLKSFHNGSYGADINRAIQALEQQLCDDCISRQAVDDAIYDYSRSCDVNYEQIMEFIDKLPSVTPERPKGKWIYKMQVMNNPYTYKCSVCKGWEKDKTKYCPNCGAEMGGGDDEET